MIKYLSKDGLSYFCGKIKTAISGKADDSAVVHITGNESVAGDKTFNDVVYFNRGKDNVDGTSTAQLQGMMASNDYWQIRSGATATDSGFLEIITGDNGNEPIYVKQFNNSASSYRTVTLLDSSGNSAFPGSITATTPATSDNSTKVATTAFVKAQGYLTSHQTLPSLSLTTSGSGNAITALSVSNHAITATKGSTFLTSHQSLADYAKLASPAFTGTPTTTTAANRTNTTQIATTAFVTNNAARYITANTTIYASTSAAGNGSGSSAANAMSIVDLQTYLASAKMMPSTTSLSGSYRLTILFVPTGSSYGDVTFDFNKMPGIRYLTIGTSTGTASTTSNYTTNSPLFNNLTVSGSPLMVTVNNIQVNGTIKADYGGQITLGVYAGFARLYTNNYGRIDVGNGTYNIHNGGTNCLCYATEHGQIILNTATMTFNFREQCYFTTAIFAADAVGRVYVNYGRSKFTGTQPVVTQTASGTKTGTSATAAGTAAKVVTLAEGQTFTLANNAVAYVTFDNTNTAANPTLNINSTGAKPIYFNGSAIPANYINKHIQYKFTYNGTQYVCNNTFQRVEQIQSMSLFSYGSNYNTTYNSGSWNWDGFSRYWGNGCWVNNNFQGNLTGNVTGNLTGNASTATKLPPQAAAALPTGNLAQDGLQLVEVYNNSYPYNYGNVINVQGTTHRGAGQLFLAWSGNDNGIANIYYRNKRDSITTWSDWKQIAFTDSNITGNAATATKLGTSTIGTSVQPIYLNQGTATAVNSALKSCSAVVESEAVTNNIFKIASGSMGSAYNGLNLVILIQNIMGGNAAIWRISLNASSTAGVFSSGTSVLVDNIGLDPANFIVAYKSNSGGNLDFELYTKIAARYAGYRFTVIQECWRNSQKLGNILTLYNQLTTTGTAAITSGYTALTTTKATVGMDISGNAATATTLATARNINGTSFDGSANITTANWGTARNISISDSDGTNTGTAVSVNGSANATLKLPATIKASITGNCSGTSSNVTGTVAIANGGTGATTRLNAVKALTNENVGSAPNYFLTITTNWAKAGYTSVADAKTALGLKSAAYTESSAYATSSHTHSYLPLSGGTMTGTITANEGNIIKRDVTNNLLSIYGGTSSTNGARFELYGGTRSTNPGSFLITASIDSSNNKQLLGKPDGTLTWGGTAISLNGHTHSYLPLSGGTLTGSVNHVGLTYKSTTIDRADTTTDSNTEIWPYNYSDKNNLALGNYGFQRGYKDGYNRLRFRLRNTGNKWADLVFQLDDDNEFYLWLSGTSGTSSSGFHGNITGSSSSCTGNAATATKLATARTINGVSFDGSANITVADSTKVAKAGDTMTGNLTISKAGPVLCTKSTGMTRNTAPSAAVNTVEILGQDSAGKSTWGIYHTYGTDMANRAQLIAYNGKSTDTTWSGIGIGYDANGNVSTNAPTPAFGDNTTKIATTAFVYSNAAKHLAAATSIYVAKAATGNGSGSSTSNYMSLADLRNYLATVHMHSSTADLNGSYTLTLLFKAGDSFGSVTFDSNKLPGIRAIVVNTSTGVSSTSSNYSTNSPTFGNLTVTGPISATIRNINCTGSVCAQYGAYISLDTYIAASKFLTSNYGIMNVAKNIVIDVCDAHTDYLFQSTNYGLLMIWPGATVSVNFRTQCYYSRAIASSSTCGTIAIWWSHLKLTGTVPMAVWGGSGTLTGTSETAAGTAAKVVTLADGQTFTLATNATAKVKFTNDNTAANPTLNINNTGAKAIYWNNAAVSANMIVKNFVYDVKYNGTQYVIQNAIKRLTNNDFGIFRTGGDYATTYNSGSWNFSGWSLYFGTGIENGNWRGSVIGNIQQKVSTANSTYPILFTATANATADTSTYPCFGSGVKINPSTSTIYATTFSGAFSGNASTATTLQTARTINGTSFNGSANITTANWGTARNISISDSDGTNTGTAVSVNGSGNATLKLPATIKASITGNCSGSSGSCTGNAATATKLGTSNVGSANNPIYLAAGVPTATGGTLAKAIQVGVGASAYSDIVQTIQSDNNNYRSCTIRCENGDGYNQITLGAHNEANGAPSGIAVKNTAGTVTATAPAPAADANDTRIATTKWVKDRGYITSSGSITGNAATATKFASSQSVALTGAVTGTASSQAGWSVGTIWRSCMVGQSSSTNTKPWYKVATCVVDTDHAVYNIAFLVEDTYYVHDSVGILKIHIRSEETSAVSLEATELFWMSSTASIANNLDHYVLVCPTTTNPTVELWTKIPYAYQYKRFTVLTEGTRTSTQIKWTLLNASSAGQAASITTSGTQIVSKLRSVASNVTGTVAIANGGTGATTRLNAVKALTNENVGTNATHFLTITDSWGKAGYTTVANAKTVLGLKSAAYTESSAYATSGHTHNELSKLTITTAMNGLLVKHTGIPDLTVTGGTSTQQQVRLAGAINTNGDRVSSLDTWVLPSSGWMQINLSLNESIAYNSDWTNYGTVNGDSDGKGWHSVGLSKDGSTTASVLHFSPTAYQNNKMISLGKDAAIYRWNGVYTSVAVNVSSDKRLKHDISDIPDNLLDAWEDVELKQFIFNDRKRLHTGTIAQQVEEVCSKHNVDISKYGLWCYSSWEADPETNTPAGDEYSIRYEEFLIVEAAYQRRRADRAESRITELETQLEKQIDKSNKLESRISDLEEQIASILSRL